MHESDLRTMIENGTLGDNEYQIQQELKRDCLALASHPVILERMTELCRILANTKENWTMEDSLDTVPAFMVMENLGHLAKSIREMFRDGPYEYQGQLKTY